ncbi:hypothetical protein SAMN05421504_106461 [Amycolatopsis xylanica]|uniref:Uncharacterized protein n=1 Tax=Amycolatopsis xylanica TaxID=589385 RepID=A0A1H3M233_9PSEU|nr:hypothetical protein [Amycolatopsis xylanica]SDY70761.1 hypothetical protein SAMN05421504_106461 [Amycolatopsis xylanica]
MRIKNIAVAGIAAGFLALTAGTAFATTDHAAPPAVGKATIWMSTHKAEPGQDGILLDAACLGGHLSFIQSKALAITGVGQTGDVVHHRVRVLDVDPGRYSVDVTCAFPGEQPKVAVSTTFRVLPKSEKPEPEPTKPAETKKPVVQAKAPVKQVVKVPTGAPQTGGGATA